MSEPNRQMAILECAKRECRRPSLAVWEMGEKGQGVLGGAELFDRCAGNSWVDRFLVQHPPEFDALTGKEDAHRSKKL